MNNLILEIEYMKKWDVKGKALEKRDAENESSMTLSIL